MFISRLFATLPAILLAVIGISVGIVGRHYSIGSLTAMGPGFMPVALGGLLLVLAGIMAIDEWGHVLIRQLPKIPLLPLGLAIASLLAWALLVELSGFVPAALVQLVLASLASRHENWGGVGFSIILITAGTYVMFVIFLGLPIKAFG